MLIIVVSLAESMAQMVDSHEPLLWKRLEDHVHGSGHQMVPPVVFASSDQLLDDACLLELVIY